MDDVTVGQCHLVALRAWDKLKEPGNTSVSFPKITQGQGEAYTHVLRRLMSAVHRAVADPDTRQVLSLWHLSLLIQNVSIIPLIHTLDFNRHLP